MEKADVKPRERQTDGGQPWKTSLALVNSRAPRSLRGRTLI